MKPVGSLVAAARVAASSSVRYVAFRLLFAMALASVLLPVWRAPCRNSTGVSFRKSSSIWMIYDYQVLDCLPSRSLI